MTRAAACKIFIGGQALPIPSDRRLTVAEDGTQIAWISAGRFQTESVDV
jgi:hypothetical protein